MNSTGSPAQETFAITADHPAHPQNPAQKEGCAVAADPDRWPVRASLMFAGATALGSAVAIHEELPGEPLA